MNLKHEFNRIGHLVNGGLEKTQKETEQWVEKGSKQADAMAKQVRKQVDAGAKEIASMEEALVQHVRDNPAIYVISIAVVVGVLIAKLLIEGSRRRDTPLL